MVHSACHSSLLLCSTFDGANFSTLAHFRTLVHVC